MPETQTNSILNIAMGIIGTLFTAISAGVFFALAGLRDTIKVLFNKIDDARERLSALEGIDRTRRKEDKWKDED